MRKFFTLLTAVAMLAGTTVQAQNNAPMGAGRAAQAGTTTGESSFAWGIGLIGLGVVGTVAGIVAATASSSPSNFGHQAH